jgi:hypothetical protein
MCLDDNRKRRLERTQRKLDAPDKENDTEPVVISAPDALATKWQVAQGNDKLYFREASSTLVTCYALAGAERQLRPGGLRALVVCQGGYLHPAPG